jgi:cellulose synthase/poly-beta-1,6-N-acetylglucosamine synthase-like glycosyltransferase
MIIEVIFWILIGTMIYSFLGYTVVIMIIRCFVKPVTLEPQTDLPLVTLFICAYNESDVIKTKIANTNSLDYPKEKIVQLWVTDGSTDGSNNILESYSHIKVLHEDKRNGKIGAINRGMEFVDTPIVIFTDANALLSPESIKAIVSMFADLSTGCVTGEKRILKSDREKAVSSGEGIYWKYESFIKKLESDINSTIGASGEIFAIRTNLFTKVPSDTILDDFAISLGIAAKGYKIKYAPRAIAMEHSSSTIREELKRKVRIAAGGIQTLMRMKFLLNIFKYKMLSFQYWSHKVIRWTFLPFAMIICFILNILIITIKQSTIYDAIAIIQFTFYFLAAIGLVFRNVKSHLHFIFVPYYIVTMNYAELKGLYRYVKGKQSINWEKSKRNQSNF